MGKVSYTVKQNKNKWQIVREDGVVIDEWDKEYLARNRLVAIEALNKSWNKRNEASKTKDL